jgi:hypothetical protein
MKLNVLVTLLVYTVSMLVSGISAMASTTPAPNNTSSTQAKSEKTPEPKAFGFDLEISRNTSLIDHKDGSQSDGLDIVFLPSLSAFNGKISAQMAYSQNLRNQYSQTENDFADIPVTYAFKAIPLNMMDLRFVYSLTAVIPVSKYSRIKDELQTALSGRIGLSMTPADGQGFSAAAGVTLGRNFHNYEEDINGAILNQYSSNQNLNLGYGFGSFKLSVSFVNRSRQTYKGNTKSTFELTEEVGYSVNDNFSLALGHTNAGSTLKANGVDSNIELIDENSSVVYGTIGFSY